MDFDNVPVATIEIEAKQQKIGDEWMKMCYGIVHVQIQLNKPESHTKIQALANKLAEDFVDIIEEDQT